MLYNTTQLKTSLVLCGFLALSSFFPPFLPSTYPGTLCPCVHHLLVYPSVRPFLPFLLHRPPLGRGLGFWAPSCSPGLRQRVAELGAKAAGAVCTASFHSCEWGSSLDNYPWQRGPPSVPWLASGASARVDSLFLPEAGPCVPAGPAQLSSEGQGGPSRGHCPPVTRSDTSSLFNLRLTSWPTVQPQTKLVLSGLISGLWREACQLQTSADTPGNLPLWLKVTSRSRRVAGSNRGPEQTLMPTQHSPHRGAHSRKQLPQTAFPVPTFASCSEPVPEPRGPLWKSPSQSWGWRRCPWASVL